jgi:RNAse (barnase) inhibitor barstar
MSDTLYQEIKTYYAHISNEYNARLNNLTNSSSLRQTFHSFKNLEKIKEYFEKGQKRDETYFKNIATVFQKGEEKLEDFMKFLMSDHPAASQYEVYSEAVTIPGNHSAFEDRVIEIWISRFNDINSLNKVECIEEAKKKYKDALSILLFMENGVKSFYAQGYDKFNFYCSIKSLTSIPFTRHDKNKKNASMLKNN